jgi:hypothetical protein
MRSGILFLILLSGFFQGLSQSKSYQILDASSGEPVPFASVITGPGTGTISNVEGYFTVDLTKLESGSIIISCMGYESLKLEESTLTTREGRIELKPAAINLNEVRVGSRIPSADEIIREVRNKLNKNYVDDATGYRLYYRESEHMNFQDLVLEVEKASDMKRSELQAADARLQKLGRDIVASNPRKFLDFKGSWKRSSDTSSVLKVQRATELIDHNKDFSMDNIQERAQQIVLSHLDTSQTYKVKSGMFKIEDSISPGKDFMEKDKGSDSTDLGYLKSKANALFDIAGWQDGTLLRGLLNPEDYSYSFLKATYFDGYYVYAVGFEPRKRRSKFSGTLYVESNSFAVLKADYAYAKNRRGQKVNFRLLLGIKYEENLNRGTVIFKRDINNTFFPYYIQKEFGNYIYLHRNLKFTENSRRKKKVRFDFLMEGGVRQRESMLVQLLETEGSQGLSQYSEPEKISLQQLDHYEPTIWQDSEIIAPLEEMKNFKVSED